MKILIRILIFICVLSCEKVKQTVGEVVEDEAVEQKTETNYPTKGEIAKIKYVDIIADEKAKTVIQSWQAYNTISKSINDLKKADVSFFTGDFNAFELAVKDLETTLPKTIDTAPVKARILALKTVLYKFQDIVNLSTTTKEEQLKVIKDIFQALSNLTFQINKKFEKEAQNYKKYIE